MTWRSCSRSPTRITVLYYGEVLASGEPDAVAADRARSGSLPRDGRLMLRLENVHAYYGLSHILHGVFARSRRSRNRLAARPQRRRQDHDAAGDHGFSRAEARRHHLPRPRDRRHGALSHFPDRPGLRAAGARHYSAASPSRKISPSPRAGGASGAWTLKRIYELFPRLRERARFRGSKLSGGEQQMLSIARALLLNPELIILDEPSEGLAPLIVQEILDILLNVRAQGVGVLIVEQNLSAPPCASPTGIMSSARDRSVSPARARN